MYKQPTIKEEIEDNLLIKIKRLIPKTLKGYRTYEEMRSEMVDRIDKLTWKKHVK